MSVAPEPSLPPARPSSIDARRARQRRSLVVFCGLSLGAHLGLVAGWVLAPAPAKPAINLDEAIVKTRLVKLGKPRDENLLPRLPTSPPPPPPETPAPARPETPTPQSPTPSSARKPTAAEVLEKFSQKNSKPTDVRDIYNRFGEDTDEGQRDGDAEGDALKGELKKTYFQQVIAHIRKRMEVSSTLSDEERIRLKATLTLRIAADGGLMDVRIQQTSGSSVFDNDVLTAARRAAPLPAPPPLVRGLVDSGIGVNFCPTSCS